MSEQSFTDIAWVHTAVAKRKADLVQQGKPGRREWNLVEKRAVAHLEKMAKLGHRPIVKRMKSFEIEFTWTDDGRVLSFVGCGLTVVFKHPNWWTFIDGAEEVLAVALMK